MATHLFTLILGSDTPCTDDVAERVFLEVGDDTVFGMCNAAAYIDFEREADSFREAVLSAIAAVERIGLRVEHVEPGDYVSRAEIARRMGKSREYVCQIASGGTGHEDFPPPVCNVSERSPCWRWSDVAPWLVRKGMLAAEEADRASFFAMVNTYLDCRRLIQTETADSPAVWGVLVSGSGMVPACISPVFAGGATYHLTLVNDANIPTLFGHGPVEILQSRPRWTLSADASPTPETSTRF